MAALPVLYRFIFKAGKQFVNNSFFYYFSQVIIYLIPWGVLKKSKSINRKGR
jgi:hypothetical protein